jgi:ParB/RepB/Spo0J family partition protein
MTMQPQIQIQKKIVIAIHPQISVWREDADVHDEALSKDLKDNKQLDSLLCRKISETEDTINVQLLGGYCRYRELTLMGVKPEDMKLNIREHVSDKEALTIAFSHNRFRKDLSHMAEAKAFNDMKKEGMDIDEISLKTGYPPQYVKEHLALLELPKYIQEAMTNNKIKKSYAQALLLLQDHPAQQKQLFARIAANDYTSPKNAEQAKEVAKEILSEHRHQKTLAIKYGNCPKCDSDQLEEPSSYSNEKEALICKKCSHKFNRKTREPWSLTELRKDADKLGLEVTVVDEKKTVVAAKSTTQLIQEQQKKMKELEKGNIHTVRTIDEVLTPLLKTQNGKNNVYKFRITGQKIEIDLIEDTEINLTASMHDFRTGEKTKVVCHSLNGYYEDGEAKTAANIERTKKLLETLSR